VVCFPTPRLLLLLFSRLRELCAPRIKGETAVRGPRVGQVT
jgi:hypothetical protein